MRLAGQKYLGDAAAVRNGLTIEPQGALLLAELRLAHADRHKCRRGFVVQKRIHFVSAKRFGDQGGDVVHGCLHRRGLHFEQSLEHRQQSVLPTMQTVLDCPTVPGHARIGRPVDTVCR